MGKRTTDVHRVGDIGKGKGAWYKCGKQGHRTADCRTRVNMVGEEEDEDDIQPVGGVWSIGQVEILESRESWPARHRFAAIAVEDEVEIPVMAVEFSVAKTRKPLASDVRMVKAGNHVLLDSEDSYIENRMTGERM